MDPLVTLGQAKHHLKITHSDEDDDIALKMEQASAVVVEYLKDQADEDWTVDTVPAQVQAAILVQLGELRRNRGDDDPGKSGDYESGWYLSPCVTRLLHRLRDPTLA